MTHWLYTLPFRVQFAAVLWGMLLLAFAINWIFEKARTRSRLDASMERGFTRLRQDAEFRARTAAMFPKPELRPDESAMRGIPPKRPKKR